MTGDLTAIFVIGSMCLCAVLIVAASLFYRYKKEQLKAKERLAAIEKGIAPKDLTLFENNGTYKKYYSSRKEAEIYGGTKLLIIGLFLTLALYVSSSPDGFKGAVWGFFVAGIGLAKIFVGLLMKRPSEEN